MAIPGRGLPELVSRIAAEVNALAPTIAPGQAVMILVRTDGIDVSVSGNAIRDEMARRFRLDANSHAIDRPVEMDFREPPATGIAGHAWRVTFDAPTSPRESSGG